MSGDAWSELMGAALLGTERQPAPAPAEDGSPLAETLARAGGESAEGRLLRMAALAAPYRRAGRLPARDDRPLPAPAASDGAPLCPPAAALHLVTMLRGEHGQALPEWLAAAARAGWIVPPEHLPVLLDAARGRGELRERLPAVLGARGRWLASLRREWGFAAGAVAEEGEGEDAAVSDAWATGTTGARVELLKGARRRDPAGGRTLLESTWTTEPARERAALLAALETGLSLEDEPFLERALDDRSKEVRAAAALLLSGLDGSRLVERMTERALAWVAVTRGGSGLLARVTGGGGPEFAVELPAACDREMARDGVDSRAVAGLGERGWWLAQVLAAVPPHLWSERAGAPPERCVAALRKHELDRVLLSAWAAAAERHRDAAWAEALIPAWERWTGAAGAVLRVSVPALVSVLPPERAEAVALRLLEPRKELTASDAAAQVLPGVPAPWSAELTRALLRRIPRAEGGLPWMLQALLQELATRMDPAAALDELAAADKAPRGKWTDLLNHRHAMLEALKR